MKLLDKISRPGFDLNSLKQWEKIELVIESNGELIDLLEGETIEDYLYLQDCTSLTHLPEGLKIAGHLDMSGCTSLTHLPEGLRSGDLDLNGCVSLKSLPKDLKVDGNLNLAGCDNLMKFPGIVRAQSIVAMPSHLKKEVMYRLSKKR